MPTMTTAPDPANSDPVDIDTEDTTDGPVGAPNKSLSHRSAYLPVLPAGWEYEVTLRGPGDSSITVEPQGEAFAIRYAAENEPARVNTAPTFRHAAKIAASGAKVMDRVYRADEEARKARDEALGVLGSEQTTPRT